MTSTHSHGHGWFNNAYLLLTLTALFWAGNATAGKLGAALIEPGALTFTRWFLAVLILYPFVRHKLRKDWPVLKANSVKFSCSVALGLRDLTWPLRRRARHHRNQCDYRAVSAAGARHAGQLFCI